MTFEEFAFACGIHELDSHKIAVESVSFNGGNDFSMDFRYIDDPKEISATFVSNPHTPKLNEVPLNAEQGSFFTPKKIIRSGNRTIVFWEDGTKTIVKRGEYEEDNPYHAFTAAVCKKIFGSNSAVKKVLKDKVNSYVGKDYDDDCEFVFADALKLFRRRRGFVDRET